MAFLWTILSRYALSGCYFCLKCRENLRSQCPKCITPFLWRQNLNSSRFVNFLGFTGELRIFKCRFYEILHCTCHSQGLNVGITLIIWVCLLIAVILFLVPLWLIFKITNKKLIVLWFRPIKTKKCLIFEKRQWESLLTEAYEFGWNWKGSQNILEPLFPPFFQFLHSILLGAIIRQLE